MTTTNTNRSIGRLEPVTILNPYPERLHRHQGVRQHTPPIPLSDWMAAHPLETTTAHHPFLASLQPLPATNRRHRSPWIAVGLYAIGQAMLAAAIAAESIGPLTGIAVCVSWRACGLALCLAATLSERTLPPGSR